MTLTIDVVTLFPELFAQPLQGGMTGRALTAGHLLVHTTTPRTFAVDKHRSVDDAPYGGGAGMVMRPEPLVAALEWIEGQRGRGHRLLLTPRGVRLKQTHLRAWSLLPHVVLVCGRYEGMDERVGHFVDEEISLGDFVLTGGEWAALAIIDGITRLLPGVLHNAVSTTQESFEQDLLEHPQYTRPPVFRGLAVPDVLLSGHHERIQIWRHQQALLRTYTHRPDLLVHKEGNDEDHALLQAALATCVDEKMAK